MDIYEVPEHVISDSPITMEHDIVQHPTVRLNNLYKRMLQLIFTIYQDEREQVNFKYPPLQDVIGGLSPVLLSELLTQVENGKSVFTSNYALESTARELYYTLTKLMKELNMDIDTEYMSVANMLK